MAVITNGPPNVLTPNQIAGYAGGLYAKLSGEDVVIAVAIALAESGGNANAHNPVPPDNSYGLWQINMIGELGEARLKEFNLKTREDLFRPDMNSLAMAKIHAGKGWNEWSTYKNGRYRAFMDKAREGAKNPAGTSYSPSPATADPDMDVLGNVLKLLMDAFGPIVIRVAGFLGGVVAIILAIVLYAKQKRLL